MLWNEEQRIKFCRRIVPALREGESLLVIDGLDERGPCAEALLSPLRDQTLFKYVICTTRPYGVIPSWTFGLTFELEGITLAQAEKLRDTLARAANISDQEKEVKFQLIQKIIPQPLVCSPLMLTLLLFVLWKVKQQLFPQDITQTTLYQFLMDGLLERYLEHPDVQSYLRAADLDPENPDDKPIARELTNTIQTILSDLAFESFSDSTERGLLLDQETVRRKLVLAYKTGLPQWPAATYVRFNPISHLRYAGLIKSNSEISAVEFTHLTFAEFFAAHHLINKLIIDERRILDFVKVNAEDQQFHDIFKFASGLIVELCPQYLSRFFDALFEEKSATKRRKSLSQYNGTWDQEKLNFLIVCLQESGVDHAWCNERNILAFIGRIFYEASFPDEDDNTPASALCRFLSRRPRVSSRIHYENHVGLNRIALMATNEICRINGSLGVKKSMHTIQSFTSTLELTQQELMDWLDLTLTTIALYNNPLDPEASKSGMEKVETIYSIFILLTLNATIAFERILHFFETELKELLCSKESYQPDFFKICHHHAQNLNDQQVNRILTLAERIIPTFQHIYHNAKEFFTFLGSVLKFKSIRLGSIDKTITDLVHARYGGTRFELTKMLSSVTINPDHDDHYLILMRTLAQDGDSRVRRELTKLFGVQTDFVVRQWNQIELLFLNLRVENDLPFQIEMIITLFNLLRNEKFIVLPDKINFIVNQLYNLVNLLTLKQIFLELRQLLEVNHPLQVEEKENIIYKLVQHLMRNNDFSPKVKFESNAILFLLEETIFAKNQHENIMKLFSEYNPAPHRLRVKTTNTSQIVRTDLLLTDEAIIPKVVRLLSPSTPHSPRFFNPFTSNPDPKPCMHACTHTVVGLTQRSSSPS